MKPIAARPPWPARLGVGLAAGAAMACVDNFAFQGEVSPIIITVLLLAVTGASGATWGRRGWVTSLAAWAIVPSAHGIKHVLRMPDTLHPNTYASIGYLAAFSLAVAVAGTACGLLLRRLAAGAASHDSKPA